MKKLNLSKIQTGTAEVLSREQLKKVLGGQMIPLTGGDTCSTECTECNGTVELKNCDPDTCDIDPGVGVSCKIDGVFNSYTCKNRC